jgi:organic hydroperoxide reductase OsmC/OhrA
VLEKATNVRFEDPGNDGRRRRTIARMDRSHRYEMAVRWTGNLGQGTATYRAYGRDHELSAEKKATPIAGSSDPAFRGDPAKYNPEELLVGAASACHMLWVLHLCADAGLIVTAYRDAPVGHQVEHPDGSGEFVRIELRPEVELADSSRAGELAEIHRRAHAKCAIARSLACEVTIASR